jgi:hypothetical protein
MPPKKFEVGNTAAKGKAGKQHERTAQFKEFAHNFSKAAWPKVLARMDEIPPADLAKLIYMFQNYADPIKKQVSIEHTKGIEVPEEITALTYEQLSAIKNIIEGKQPAYQVTNGD